MEKNNLNAFPIPLLSVCLITFNHEYFIGKAIEGILRQKTNFNFELVIGDDCSTDNTVKILMDYEKKFPGKFKLFTSLKNLGLKENFLRTVRSCEGRYIAYLEGDDHWISDNKLQRQVDLLENHPDVSLVHTNFKLWSVDENTIEDRIIKFDGVCVREVSRGVESVIAEFEGRIRPIKTSTCCYRRDLLERILKNDEFAYRNADFPTQDFQLFQDMSVEGKFQFIDEDTTVIGLHDSISAPKDRAKQLKYRLGFFKISTYYIDKYKLPKTTVCIWMSRQLYYFMNICFIINDSILAKYIVHEARKRGFSLSWRQRMLFYGINNYWFRRLTLPIYKYYSSFV